ncbi:MAG TPA: hypothetical protein VGC65_09785 [Bacteroidia bacterium]|jgi:hypothetical protein
MDAQAIKQEIISSEITDDQLSAFLHPLPLIDRCELKREVSKLIAKKAAMQLLINDSRKIINVQEEFNTIFPYLRLEFFALPHKRGGGSDKKLIKENSKTFGECRSTHTKGNITITPQMTVNDLEQQFSTIYGLFVQVFRKSGKVWLETTVTDGWSLEEQNQQGEALSKMAG